MAGQEWNINRCLYCDVLLQMEDGCVCPACKCGQVAEAEIVADCKSEDAGSIPALPSKYDSLLKPKKNELPPLPARGIKRYQEIELPRGLLGQERIVGIVNFRGDVIIATEHRVLRMSHDEFTEVKFEQVENR